MIRLLLSRGANITLRGRDDDDDYDAETLARRNDKDEAAALLADVRIAGGTWDDYLLFPRKRVLALRVLCEQGRASTDDPLLRRLFPYAPPACDGARVKSALESALAAQPHVRALIDVDALAAAQELALVQGGVLPPPPKKRTREDYRAVKGGHLPRAIFWHILSYWRTSRDDAPASSN